MSILLFNEALVLIVPISHVVDPTGYKSVLLVEGKAEVIHLDVFTEVMYGHDRILKNQKDP